MKSFILFLLLAFGLSAYGQRFIQTFNSADDAWNANLKSVHTNIFVSGRVIAGDGGGGQFVYDRNSVAVTNIDRVWGNKYGGRLSMVVPVSVDKSIPPTKYRVYEPTVTIRTMLDPATSPWQYNHDTSLMYYGDRWFAQWNANTYNTESYPGQVLIQSTSTDFITWTTPVLMFQSATYSSNPVAAVPFGTEWQPGMVRVGTELWSIWSRFDGLSVWPLGGQVYFSRLTSPTGKWANTLLNITYTDTDGNVYYGSPTQNPIQLLSGRVICPVVFNSPSVVSPPPTGWTTNDYFWINKKRAGCIVTDDNGVTWKLGGVTTLPGNDHALWEPIIQQSSDGSISMWCRNMDYKVNDSDSFLLWAQGYSDGDFFDPLTTIRVDVSSSRLGMLHQPGKYERHIGLHNDWQSALGANFISSRRNASLYFSRSTDPDMAPGVNFSGDFGSVSYPQGDIHGGKIHVLWTQSQQPNYLMTSEINPAPDVDSWYISPRRNDAVNPFVVWTNSSPTRFIHNSVSEMESVRSTQTWSDTNKVTVGAWLYKNSSGSSTTLQTIVDNRLLQPGQAGGFVFGTLSGQPAINLVLTNSTGISYIFSTLSVPFSEWVYVGLSVDLSAVSATAYVVRANGTATTETKALGSTHAGINGATLYMGRAINNSSWQRHIGDVRRVRVINGVSATADNHRYLHGTEQTALSVTDWAGTETSPGTPSFDYYAADGHAGSNDATWLAEWTQTGQIFRGYASSATLSGTNTLLVTGSGVASVEIPKIGAGQQYIFASQLFITNKTTGYDQCFLTIGDKETQTALISRAANPTKFELFSKITGTYTEVGDYITGKWLPLTVKIGGGSVYVALNKTNAVALLNEKQPRVYIGQGYLGTYLTAQLDGFHLDMDRAQFHVSELSQQYSRAVDPTLRSITIQSSNVTATVQGPAPFLNVKSDGGSGFRATVTIDGSVPVLTFRDSDNPATNNLIGAGTALVLMNTLSQSTTPARFQWDSATGDEVSVGPSVKKTLYGTSSGTPEIYLAKMNGAFSTPAAPTAGMSLGNILFTGNDGTNVLGGKAGMRVFAANNWNYTNTGTYLTLDTTASSGTARLPRLSIDQDGALYVGTVSTSPSIEAGTGVPSASRNNGSIFLRTDGTGPNIYGRVNSAWVDLAGGGGGGVATTDSPTWTGAHVFSKNGALSLPTFSITGTPITGGTATTTKPLALIETAGSSSSAWSTSGTMLGVNAPSGFAGRFFDFQLNGVSYMSMNSGGALSMGGSAFVGGNISAGATANLSWSGLSEMLSPSDGVILLQNAANSGFTRLQLGGTTTSFPAIERSGTTVAIKLADGSADAPLTASTVTATTFTGALVGNASTATALTSTLDVAGGGTGVSSLTTYAPVFGGTTGTGAVQSGTVGTAGQVLTSNGAGALPTFQAAASGSVASDTIWDAVGDLAVGNGANSAVRLPPPTKLSGQVLYYGPAGVEWVHPSTHYLYRNDLLINQIPGDWNSNSASGGQGGNAAEAGAVGVLYAATSTASSTYRHNYLGGNNQFALGRGRTIIEWKVRLPNLSDPTDTYSAYVGLYDHQTTPVDGAWFEYTHGVNSGNWQCKVANNSSTTTTANTSVAATTSWTTFTIDANAGATEVKFYIDGTLVGTETGANIPPNTRTSNVSYGIAKTGGTTNIRYIYADYLDIYVKY